MTDDVRRMARLQRLALERQAPPRRPLITWLLILAALFVGYGARALQGAERVSMIVRPTVMLRRGDIRVEVRVPRDVDNRTLAIAWSSDTGTAGNTVRPLEGEDAAVIHVLELPSQPAANYTFTATVLGGRDRAVRARAEASIHVPDQETR